MKDVMTADFDEVVKSGTVLVDFWAPWCAPCRAMGALLERVSKEYEDIEFVKVDIAENADLATRFDVSSIPAIHLFKDGEAVAFSTGIQPPASVKSFIDSNM